MYVFACVDDFLSFVSVFLFWTTLSRALPR
jgi:hypothetical protein